MHQNRRKSGNASMTDVRKSVTATDLSTKHRRPGMTRRHTPVSAQKLGRSHRERERDRHDGWDDERESFPQFCMTCEKQFVPHDEKFLYCSEACRRIDQHSSSTSSHATSMHQHGYANAVYPFGAAGQSEPKDIIPRASPSRPTSVHFNNSPPASPSMAVPATHHQHHHTSAISALRSLTLGSPSPPSAAGSQSSSLWPFGRSVATSPGTSYTRPSAPYLSSTYDNGYHHGGGNAYTYDVGAGAVDRPLPSRHPSVYSRPKSIELVTPVVGR